MGACPLKDLEVPVYGSKRVSSCKGHPCACAYWRSSRCPFFESKGAPLIGFMMCLCDFSAGWETPKILKWARASGFPWDEDTCAFASKNGHLEDLQ